MSISRSTLDLMLKDEKENGLRKIPIKTEMIDEEGVWGRIDYKFPETRTLPSSPFYFVKRIRDYLWIGFTKNQTDKSRMLTLLADKKMEEARMMDQLGKEKQLIIGTTIEAIDKLKWASDELKNDQLNKVEKIQLQKQINQAKYVYKEVIKSFQIGEKEKEDLAKRLEEGF